jgi:hypothetical protein
MADLSKQHEELRKSRWSPASPEEDSFLQAGSHRHVLETGLIGPQAHTTPKTLIAIPLVQMDLAVQY